MSPRLLYETHQPFLSLAKLSIGATGRVYVELPVNSTGTRGSTPYMPKIRQLNWSARPNGSARRLEKHSLSQLPGCALGALTMFRLRFPPLEPQSHSLNGIGLVYPCVYNLGEKIICP